MASYKEKLECVYHQMFADAVADLFTYLFEVGEEQNHYENYHYARGHDYFDGPVNCWDMGFLQSTAADMKTVANVLRHVVDGYTRALGPVTLEMHELKVLIDMEKGKYEEKIEKIMKVCRKRFVERLDTYGDGKKLFLVREYGLQKWSSKIIGFVDPAFYLQCKKKWTSGYDSDRDTLLPVVDPLTWIPASEILSDECIRQLKWVTDRRADRKDRKRKWYSDSDY